MLRDLIRRLLCRISYRIKRVPQPVERGFDSVARPFAGVIYRPLVLS